MSKVQSGKQLPGKVSFWETTMRGKHAGNDFPGNGRKVVQSQPTGSVIGLILITARNHTYHMSEATRGRKGPHLRVKTSKGPQGSPVDPYSISHFVSVVTCLPLHSLAVLCTLLRYMACQMLSCAVPCGI